VKSLTLDGDKRAASRVAGTGVGAAMVALSQLAPAPYQFVQPLVAIIAPVVSVLVASVWPALQRHVNERLDALLVRIKLSAAMREAEKHRARIFADRSTSEEVRRKALKNCEKLQQLELMDGQVAEIREKIRSKL
jgi:hypothetical protein